MNVSSSQTFLALFQLVVSVIGTMAVCLGAYAYLRRVRLERPAIGRFNGRDVVILFVFLVVLPGFYLLLPEWALTTILAVSFSAALSIGLRPILEPTKLWLLIGLLIGANIWMGHHLINNVSNWHWVWAENSVIVMMIAVAVSNLYVQGGMQVKHVAWFAGGLAIYDTLFTFVWHISNQLLREFVNHPLFPALGMRINFDEAVVGLGDLLVYAGFTIAAFKAYGRSGLRLALGLVLLFGAVMPSLSGYIINYVDSRLDVVIPAQTWFGPAAIAGYAWLRHRYGRERTMKEYLASAEGERLEPAATAVSERPKIETESVSA